MSDQQADPIELMVIKKHEQALIDLMSTTIDDIKLNLHCKDLLANIDIDQEYKELTEKNRMRKVLSFVQMLINREETEEKAKEIFDKFLEALREEGAWDGLRDRLCKLIFQYYTL